MRKKLSLVLAFCLILSMFTGLNMMSASAASGDYKISIDTPSNLPAIGQSFKVNINAEVAAGKKLGIVDFTLPIPAGLEIVDASSVKPIGGVTVHATKGTNDIRVILAKATYLTSADNGTIATVTYKVVGTISSDVTIDITNLTGATDTGDITDGSIAPDNSDNTISSTPSANEKILFKITPVTGTQGASIMPLSVSTDSEEILYVGKEYKMDFYVNSISEFSQLYLPLQFNHNAIAITGTSFGTDFLSTWGSRPVRSTNTVYGPHYANNPQATTPQGYSYTDYTKINSNGKILFAWQSISAASYPHFPDDKGTTDDARIAFSMTFIVLDVQKIDFKYEPVFFNEPSYQMGGGVYKYWIDEGTPSNPYTFQINFDNEPVIAKPTVEINTPNTLPDYTYEMKPGSKDINAFYDTNIEAEYPLIHDAIIAELKASTSWTVKKNGNTITATDVLDSTNSLTPKFTASMPTGATPDVYSLTITGTSNGVPISKTLTITVIIPDNEVEVSGYAFLAGKPLDVQTARPTDKGIKVELIDRGTNKVVGEPIYTTETKNDGDEYDGTNFTLYITDLNADQLQEKLSDTTPKYMLRFSRIGYMEEKEIANLLGDRKESYLCAEVLLDLSTKGTLAYDEKIIINPSRKIFLYPGAYDAPSASKLAITKADFNIIQALVGLASFADEFGDDNYSEIFDIDEDVTISVFDAEIVGSYLQSKKLSGGFDGGTGVTNTITYESDNWTYKK